MKLWFIDHTITLGIGLALGWILLKRPQWIEDLYQAIKHKIKPS